MLKNGLINEFKYETESTRKLLNAIPDSALSWKPSEKSWTTAELASHIAAIYSWYDGTINQDVFDLAAFKYEREDISSIRNIIDKFEENAAKALTVLENMDEQSLFNDWRLVSGDHAIIPTIKKVAAVRSFLMSHLYHHRGEMIVYLRATGNKVPGMYGPTAEDMGK